MLRKIFRTGNSIVVSIPKDILDELKLSAGDFGFDQGVEFTQDAFDSYNHFS